MAQGITTEEVLGNCNGRNFSDCKDFENGFLLLFYPLDAHEKSSGRNFLPPTVHC
jgi:hypothetical protein